MATSKTVLGDVCTVIDCEHKTAPTQEEGIPLIRTPNIGTGHLILETAKRVSAAIYAAWTTRAKPEPGDLIMAREAPVGNVALIRKEQHVCLGQRTVLLRLRDKKVTPHYLNYLLNSPAVNTYVNLLANGATVGHLNVADIRKLSLPEFPSRTVQDKIAAILSVYDDLIENNRRRIALLEKMAEEIYREWFVRMRFPGHEQTKFEKGVPVEWGQVQLGDIADINSHSIKRGREPEWIEYLDISAVSTNQMTAPNKLKFSEAPGRARRLVKHGDVIWSSVRPGNRAYCLVLNPPESLVVSTGFAVITPKNAIPFSFLHRAVTTDSFVEQMVSVAKGAAYPATSFEDFEKAEILLPDVPLLKRFREVSEPLLLLADKLRKQVPLLTASRDELLPRLISGKLPVEALDIRFPPSMADQGNDIPEIAPS